MNYFKKGALEKVADYEIELYKIEDLHENSVERYGEIYKDSLLCANIELRIAWIIVKIDAVKYFFNV